MTRSSRPPRNYPSSAPPTPPTPTWRSTPHVPPPVSAPARRPYMRAPRRLRSACATAVLAVIAGMLVFSPAFVLAHFIAKYW